MQKLKSKVADSSVVVGVLGMGYVGIPIAQSMSEAGLKVIGFDIIDERVEQLNAGISHIKHISNDVLVEMKSKGFYATTDFSISAECDILIICVPTPLNKTQDPDLSFITATMDSISPYFREEQLVALESTTWPGTTREVLLPYVEAKGLQIGENFYLAYSPEREDPGNEFFTTKTIPKVLGGLTENCKDIGAAFYRIFIETVVEVSSAEAAEMVKLLENIHRSVNIGLVNELKVVTDSMQLDIYEIIDAAKTKPFGFTAYYPGPGIGGHCIPIDPYYLTWKAKEYGLHTRFIELAGEINKAMPQYVVNKTINALNHAGKSLKNSKVLALGIAYKRDVDDMRESPSVHVMEILRDWGAEVEYSDPNVPVFPEMREHNFDLESVDLTPENIGKYDVVILLTDHTSFDYEMIKQNASIIVDTRGKYRNDNNIVRS